MKRKVIVWMLCVLAVVGVMLAVPAFAAGEDQTTTTVTTADELVAAVNGGYTYVQLGADIEAELAGQTLVVDLAGYDLTVSGSGYVKAFDTANDGFDHTVCGTLTCEDGVTCASKFTAPTDNGYYYIALGSGGRYTYHRLDMKITNVVLRPSAVGVYYKAYFACDRLIEESVLSYGVAVRADGAIPGLSFRNYDATYTVNSGDGFLSGTTVNSGIVQNILSETATADANKANADTTINARLYIEIDGYGDVMAPTYSSCSLNSLLKKLDSSYSKLAVTNQNQLDDFYNQWESKTTGWSFDHIGQNELDFDAMNANLSFEEGTTNAWCYKCDMLATWTLLSDDTTNHTLAKNVHYYLENNLEYTGTAAQFISTSTTGGEVSCLHLNGHNITATKTTVFFGSGGVLNVMGSGTVTGYSAKAETGAVILANNRNSSNGINLYGGTYTKTSDSASSASIIAFGVNGRNINVYKGATVDGGTGTAIYVDGSSSARAREGYLGLHGCVVNGNVKLLDFGTYANNVSVVDATINGTLNVPAGHNVYLQGAPVISNLSVSDDANVIINGLAEGANIGLTATGYFSQISGNLDGYTSYFTPANENYGVFVRNNALYCGKDYVSNIADKFAEGTTDAYCPVCDKPVTWTPLTQILADEATGTQYAITMEAGSHYYLAEDVTYTGTATYTFLRAGSAQGDVACLHLNGKDLTTTNRGVFYSSSGVLNVMGTGTVTGHNKSASYGAVVHSNNKNVASSMNFYSGTYTTDNALATGYVVRFAGSGGRVYFYEDAVVDSGDTGNAFYLTELASTTNDSVVSIQGATVHGDISANGTAAPAVCNYAITLDNAVLNGTLDGNGTNKINLVHCVKIGLLDVEEGSLVSLDSLEPGTSVTVQNVGAFAQENEAADSYVSYFKTAWINDKIVNKDNVLTYKTNYEMNLQLDGNDQAWCPVCMEYATWKPLELNAETGRLTLTGGHVYLASDINADYAGTSSSPALLSTGSTAATCLHLNGHDIAATKAQAIFGGECGLNVMGSGTVSGYGTGSSVGAAIHCNNKKAVDGVSLYSGTYLSLRSNKGVISMGGNGGVVRVYEDAVIGAQGSTGVAVNTGAATSRACEFYLYGGTVNGNIVLPGAGGEFASILSTDNGTVNGTVSVTGTNDVTFSGRTKIGELIVAEGSAVNFENMLFGSAIKVNAVGTFTPALEDPDAWLQYFTWDNADDWVIVRNKCLYYGARTGVTTAEQTDIDALLAAYGDRVVKYGEMHNHTGAGPQADGWYTLSRWKTEMEKMGMSFATIVDHKQIAHMYHDDWITEPTTDSDVVFVGGSEPATHVTDLGLSSDKNDFHYNMLVNDPEKLLEIITNTGKFTIKEFANYADFSGNSYNDTNNKAELYDPTEYSADPDGVLQIWNYPSFKRAEFESLVDAIYDAGGLLVHVHPKYVSYMVSDNPLDYFYGADAGSGNGTAMGIEIHTGTSSAYTPSHIRNENAYQMWVDLLELGKKAYAAYGSDNHRLPTAQALTTLYADPMANSDEYMGYMNNGNYTAGWVGIRMQVGETVMGGETDFAGQRLAFSVGDMYYNENAVYDVADAETGTTAATWSPNYDATHKYVVQLYDDGGLLMESEIDPGQMNYFAIDADASAKYYRVVVWDMTQGFRVGVSNPIWNTGVTE